MILKTFPRILLACALFALSVISTQAAPDKPNILLITVDDMSCDSVGEFGCKLPGTTPHMDKLASEGLKFEMAHVQVGNCFPSRNVLLSGRYPHNSGVEGFYQVRDLGFPVMNDILQSAGYYSAIRGKVSHSTPYQPYAWDDDLTILPDGKKADMKNAESYYQSTSKGIAKAKEAGKPFFINVNISDPHKPFWKPGDRNPSSKVFTAEEVPIPGFLFDDPQVREELALYYTSVRRADDCVGATLKALEDSGRAGETMVVFLSDHGMPLPFAKTQLYHHSTLTPWIVRYPGVTNAGTTDKKHMISAVDFVPTVCELLGLEIPAGVNGRSFAPLLKGESQSGRDKVFKEYNENSGGNRHPIRAVQTKDYLYLFNPWADGERRFKTATQGTVTYKRMQALAPENPEIAARLKLFDHRAVEELYHVAKDPDCLVNVASDPAHKAAKEKLTLALKEWMIETSDHALAAFDGREDPTVLDAYLAKVEAESAERRAAKRKNKRGAGAAAPKKRKGLISLSVPELTTPGGQLKVAVTHKFTKDLGTQPVFVTLKAADGKRIERKEASATGKGEILLAFDVPTGASGSSVTVAAFVGKDFQSSLQHLNSEEIKVE